MSFEWARARQLENRLRERQRALRVQGRDASEVEMVYPLQVTFWTAQACPIEVKRDPMADSLRLERAPRESTLDLNYVHSEGNDST